MVARHFFPRALHPVLDGGEGDEDPVVTPQVPAGGAVGQRVLDDQAHGQPLHAAGVQAPGRGEVGEVGGEATAAAAAAMPGGGDEQVTGPLGAGIAEVVQASRIQGVSAGAPATARAGPRGVVAGAPVDARLR
jgi:hypothetical protein